MNGGRAAVAPVLLALVVLLPCVPVLLLGETFWFRDIYLYYLPQKALAASILRAGHLPIWDPYFHAGSALWANPDNLVAHPTTLFFLIARPEVAFGLAVASGLLLAALGAFALARRLGLSHAAALVAGATFALSGVMASVTSFHATFLALCPLPALIASWDAWLACRAENAARQHFPAQGGALALVCALAALVGLSSGAEAAIAGAVLMLAWTLAAPSPRPLTQRFAALAGCGVLALALSSPAWLPALDVLRGSTRGTGYEWSVASLWAVDAARLPELVVTGFLGDIRGLYEAGYWGRGLENGFTPYYPSLTLGPVVVALIVAGMGTDRIPTPLRRVLAALFVASIALAVAPRLVELDVASPLRFPVKFVLLGALPAALLAAAGFDASLERARQGRWPVAATVLVALAIACGLVAAWIALAPESSAEALKAYFRVPRAPILARLAGAFGQTAAWAALGLAALWLASRPGRERVAPVLLAAVVAIGLLVVFTRVNPTTPREAMDARPELADAVAALIGDGRLYRSEDESLPMRLAAPTDDAVHLARFNLATLRYYTATRHRIPVAFHVDPDGLAPSRIAEVSWSMRTLPWPERLPLLRSAGVRAVVTNEVLDGVDGLVERATLDLGGGAPTRLYALTDSSPPIRFVSRARWVDDDAAARAALREPGRDPREEVVLVGTRIARDEGPHCTGGVLRAGASLAPEPGQEIEVDSTCGGAVVIAVPFQRGLDVTIDGRPAPDLTVADAVFLGIPVGPGHHAIAWHPVARHLRLSLGLAALSALVVGWLALRKWGQTPFRDSRNGV